VPVLVDYHAENLFWLPERQGLARVGILDHQDLRIGHPAYDLVSLLEDARRDTTAEMRMAMRHRYLDLTGFEASGFDRAAHVWAAQRNLKILGLFARLVRSGKPRYLEMLPRVWGHLMRDLEHPALATLATWVTEHMPAPDAAVRARILAVAA
jgi:aminoglycoside/choline kinase family phosphotransferase